MSFLMRQVAHCDVCGHEWLTSKVPSHCAKCKSRKWNQGLGVPLAQARKFASVSDPDPIREALQDRKIDLQNKRRYRHAQTCKCLMCKPPKRGK